MDSDDGDIDHSSGSSVSRSDNDYLIETAGLQTFYVYRSVAKWRRYCLRQQRQYRLERLLKKYRLQEYLRTWQKMAQLTHRQRLVQGLLERQHLQVFWLRWYRAYRISKGIRRLEKLRHLSLQHYFLQRWRTQTKRLSRSYTETVLTKLNTIRERYQRKDFLTLWYTKIHHPFLSWSSLSFVDRHRLRYGVHRWHKHTIYRKQIRASVYLLRQRTQASTLQYYFHRWKDHIQYTHQIDRVHHYLAVSFYDRSIVRTAFRTWQRHKDERYRNELIQYERQQLIPRVRYYIGIWHNIIRTKQIYRKALEDSENYNVFRILSTTFLIWKRNITYQQYLRKQGLRALQYYQRNLVKETFQAWKRYHYIRQQKHRRYQQSYQFFRRSRLPGVLHQWREYAQYRRNQYLAREMYRQRITDKVFTHWKTYVHYRQRLCLAQVHYAAWSQAIRQRRTLQRWYRYARQRKGLRTIQEHQQERLLRMIIERWHQYTQTDIRFNRSIEIIQRNQRQRLGINVIAKWRKVGQRLIQKERNEEDAIIRPFRQKYLSVHMRQRIRQWLRYTREQQRLHLIESRIRYKHQLRSMRRVWLTLDWYRVDRQRKYRLEQAADRFRAIAIAWKSWQQWCNVYRYRVHLRMCAERIKERRGYYAKFEGFRRWKHYVKYRKELGLLYLSGLHLRSILALPLLKSQYSDESNGIQDKDKATKELSPRVPSTGSPRRHRRSTVDGHPPGSEDDSTMIDKSSNVTGYVPKDTPVDTAASSSSSSSTTASWNYIDTLLTTFEQQLKLHSQEYFETFGNISGNSRNNTTENGTNTNVPSSSVPSSSSSSSSSFSSA